MKHFNFRKIPLIDRQQRAVKRSELQKARIPEYEETLSGLNMMVQRSVNIVDLVKDSESLNEAESTGSEGFPSKRIRLRLIIRDILQIVEFNEDENFFQLGGDSLSALRLISRVNETFLVSISLRQFFKNPTMSWLVKSI